MGNIDLARGWYYQAVTMDATSGNLIRSITVTALQLRVHGVQQEVTGGFGVPSSASFAAPSSNYVPIVNFFSTTTV